MLNDISHFYHWSCIKCEPTSPRIFYNNCLCLSTFVFNPYPACFCLYFTWYSNRPTRGCFRTVLENKSSEETIFLVRLSFQKTIFQCQQNRKLIWDILLATSIVNFACCCQAQPKPSFSLKAE
jgi:hypothetical protein